MPGDVKFSQFTLGGDMQVGDQPVGLRPDFPTENFLFSFPGAGIKDANGNYMVKWSSPGASAVNWIALKSSITGNAPLLTVAGSDSAIGLSIQPFGTGALQLDDLIWPTGTGPTNGFLYTPDGTHLAFTSASVATSIVGTQHQVLANGTFGLNESGTVTLTTPQNIDTNSNVTFNSLNLSTPLAATQGGTGFSSLTNNELLVSTSTTSWGQLATANSATLVTSSSGVPSFTASMTNGQVLIGSTGATPTPASLTAGSGITITPGAGSISISTAGFPISWVSISGTSQSAIANTNYITTNASQTTITLPDHPAIGSVIAIAGGGSGGWVIVPGASATIHVGSASTTTSVTSSNRYDSITLVVIATDTWSAWNGPQTAGLTLA